MLQSTEERIANGENIESNGIGDKTLTSEVSLSQNSVDNEGASKSDALKTEDVNNTVGDVDLGGKRVKQGRPKKKKKKQQKDFLLSPQSILETIKTRTAFNSGLVEDCTKRLNEPDIDEYLCSSEYVSATNVRIEMIPANSVSVLPHDFESMKVNVHPYAITELRCIDEVPRVRDRRGRRGQQKAGKKASRGGAGKPKKKQKGKEAKKMKTEVKMSQMARVKAQKRLRCRIIKTAKIRMVVVSRGRKTVRRMWKKAMKMRRNSRGRRLKKMKTKKRM